MKYLLLYLCLLSLSLSAQTDTLSIDTTQTKDSLDIDFELIMAAWRGEEEYTLRLLKEGADVNAVSSDGISALMYAVQEGRLPIVKILVANGADINKTVPGEKPALITSVINQKTAITEYLLYRGANVNLSDGAGNTALMLACVYGLRKEVTLLLKYGADVNLKNVSGETALWLAAYSGNADFVYELLIRGADINSQNYQGYSPLMVSSMYGDTIMMKYLIQNKADVKITNKYQQTAADVAMINSNYFAFKILYQDSIISTREMRQHLKTMYQNGAYSTATSIRKQYKVNYCFPVSGSFAIGYGPELAYNDALFSTFFVWNDNRYRTSIRGGWGTRYFRNSAEYEFFNSKYQFWEKRNYLYLGLEKKFRIKKTIDINRKCFFAGAQVMYTIIRFRGVVFHPDAQLSVSPYIGYGKTGKYIGYGVRYFFYDTDKTGLSPHRISLYFTVNLYHRSNEKFLTKCSMCY